MKKPVIVVDREDSEIGTKDISVAIKEGLIRRVARVFLWNDEGKLFVQRRSPQARIFPDTWDQSAGGHVDEGELYEEAAHRELGEELGIKNVELYLVTKFYAEECDQGVMLYAWSSLYEGRVSKEREAEIVVDQDEVSSGEWFTPSQIDTMMKENPDDFAQGFLATWEKYKKCK